MTSIEWLRQELWEQFKFSFSDNIFEQAKRMHKQEMGDNSQRIIGEHLIQILEISDEEIEKFADEELGTIRTDFDFGVVQGMKWYREQLKQKNEP